MLHVAWNGTPGGSGGSLGNSMNGPPQPPSYPIGEKAQQALSQPQANISVPRRESPCQGLPPELGQGVPHQQGHKGTPKRLFSSGLHVPRPAVLSRREPRLGSGLIVSHTSSMQQTTGGARVLASVPKLSSLRAWGPCDPDGRDMRAVRASHWEPGEWGRILW